MITEQTIFTTVEGTKKNKQIEPVEGVPMVRVVDENGREIIRGWYIHHITRTIYPLGDCVRSDDVQHFVAYDVGADWNFPQDLNLMLVTPPERIEVIEND